MYYAFKIIVTLSILRLCCDINLLLCICFRKKIIINMAAGSSPQQHRLSTGIFASKLCSGGWKPGSSGKLRKNGFFEIVRKSGFPQTNHWIAVVFKLLLIILVVLFQSNTPDNMEVILNDKALENIKSVVCAPNLNWAFDINPQYIRSSTSQSSIPR